MSEPSASSAPDPLVAAIGEQVDACAQQLVPAAGATDDRLGRLALEVVTRQYQRIPAYRRLWSSRGLPPPDPARDGASWRDSPAVPVSAFKEPALALHTAPAQLVFRSSGTTSGRDRRSEHPQPYPELYRRIVDRSFPVACLDERLLQGRRRVPILSLIPTSAELPDSSLAFMADHVLARWGAPSSLAALGGGGLDADAALRLLAGASEEGPLLILATALALAALLEAVDARPPARALPPGSVIFETGGFKGRERELSRAELVAGCEQLLGVPRQRIVREYGMTELTSQAYTRALAGGDPDVFQTPPWLFWRIVDPETAEPVAPGGEGLLSFFDLGNVGSVSHLLTEDVGRAVPGGGFELIGRASQAELRGCSLTAEELLVREVR